MLRPNHEIEGTDLPTYEEKLDDHFTFEEVIAMGRDLNEVEEVGYLKVPVNGQSFFEKLYELKG